MTSNAPTDWADWLPIATLAHNNHTNSTIRTSPNEALIRWQPPLKLNNEETNNQTVEDRLLTMERFRQLAIDAINKVANKSPPPQNRWKEGQKVWLEAKNLSICHGTIKMAPR